MADQLSSVESRVPFARMSPQRRQLVKRLINLAVDRFQKDLSLNTPLQSEYTVKSLRMSLAHAFNAPVFAPTNSADVKNQIKQLAAVFCAVAEERYDDIAGTRIPSLLEDSIAYRLERIASDDTSPSMKYPIPDEDFSALLKRAGEECRSTRTAGLYANGHLSPDWDKMDDQAREDFLRDEGKTIIGSMSACYSKGLSTVEAAYANRALANQFKGIDPYAPPPSITQSDLDEFDALARRARAEMAELWKKWDKAQQAKIGDEAAHASMRANFGEGPAIDELGLVKDSLTDVASAPVGDTTSAKAPSRVPDDQKQDIAAQGGARGLGALTVATLAFSAAVLAAAVVLAVRRRRRPSN